MAIVLLAPRFLSAATPDEIESCAKALARPIFESPLKFDPKQPAVVIVDGYSSGRLLPAEFRRHGVQVIHVHSYGKPPKPVYEATFWSENFELDIPYAGNIKDLVDLLKSFQILAVLPGSDPGVLLADELSFHLSKIMPVVSNGINVARKDKFLMSEQVRDNEIDAVRQIKTADLQKALNWIRENRWFENGAKKVVVKPILSSGGEDVYFLQSEDEVAEIFKRLIGTKDTYHHLNQEILVQEFLEGIEYVVNTVSVDGHHYVTDIWVYTKRPTLDGSRSTYAVDTLLPLDGHVQRILVPYAYKVLNALGIQHGSGHAEIKIVPDRGPVLVEMNARLMGTGLPLLTQFATGHSQIDRMVRGYLDPQGFKRDFEPYILRKRAAVVSMAHFLNEPGFLSESADKEIQGIPGYLTHYFVPKPGQAVKPAVDLDSVVGEAWILDENWDVLEAAIRRIREKELDGSIIRR